METNSQAQDLGITKSKQAERSAAMMIYVPLAFIIGLICGMAYACRAIRQAINDAPLIESERKFIRSVLGIRK